MASTMLPSFDILYEDFTLPVKLSPTRIYRRGERAYWGGALQESYLHWPNIADFKAVGGNSLYIKPHTSDIGIQKLFLESEASGLIWLQRGFYLLHASCVQVGAGAVVFAGTPGAGKSTTTAAFVKVGHAPLADDMVIIQIADNGLPYVLPVGPQIKIWHTTAQGLNFDQTRLTPCFEGHDKYYFAFEGDYPQSPLLLTHLFLLHRSNRYGKQQRVPFSQVPFELLKHFPLPHQLLKSTYLQQHFKQSMAIAQHTPVWRLRRPKNFLALEEWVRELGQSVTAKPPVETTS